MRQLAVYGELRDNNLLIEHRFCSGADGLPVINLTPLSILCTTSAVGLRSGRSALILPSDVIFVFGSCVVRTRFHFPECVLLICAGENVEEPAKANPQKPDECPAAAAAAVALGINSQFIEILLILEPGSALRARPDSELTHRLFAPVCAVICSL